MNEPTYRLRPNPPVSQRAATLLVLPVAAYVLFLDVSTALPLDQPCASVASAKHDLHPIFQTT